MVELLNPVIGKYFILVGREYEPAFFYRKRKGVIYPQDYLTENKTGKDSEADCLEVLPGIFEMNIHSRKKIKK